MHAITVRLATLNDLPELTRLWYEKTTLQQQFDRRFKLAPDARQSWSSAAENWLNTAECGMVVAERENQLLGYAIGWIQPSPPGLLPKQVGYISDVAVDAHSHQGGLGRLLVSDLRQWFLQQGIQQITAYVPRQNAVEQAFWRAQGAVEWVDLMWIK
jgi:ribosomal protein S18 acetylase RimI-like enzyme